jgi:hypothetical protein
MFRRLMCRLGYCTRCEPHFSDESAAGRCIDCGKLHGVVTREELRAYADRAIAARLSQRKQA